MCYLFVLLALNTSKIIILASHTRNGLTVVLILNTSQLHCNIVKVKPLFLAFNFSNTDLLILQELVKYAMLC